MDNLYNKNGLIFWEEKDIFLRNFFESYISQELLLSLQKQNAAFSLLKVEAPILTPREFINNNYTSEDIFIIDDLVLRPETTMGTYEYAKKVLDPHLIPRRRPPIVIYQHGKSFRREQDQATKYMRLKEFHQLEFQIIFSKDTKNDYAELLYPEILNILNKLIGNCSIQASDRLPSYSSDTQDILCGLYGLDQVDQFMEVCSMSKRNDFVYSVIEIAIGTDRLLYCWHNK